MPIRTLIVNTMPPGEAGGARAGETEAPGRPNLDPPPDQPDRYLDDETKRRFQQPRKLSRHRRTDDIPPGMEGFYYLP